jgi:hypothetical protein
MSDALTFTSVSRTMKLEAINRTVATISLVLPLWIALLRLESLGGEVKERTDIVQEAPRAAENRVENARSLGSNI